MYTQTLNTLTKIPVIGFGTWGLEDGKETDSIVQALKCGYRHIDTAKIYGTEKNVAEAIKICNIPRDQLFITTKLWNSDQGYHTTLAAIDESLANLNTDYVDLYLIHWPFTDEMKGENRRKETWRAMEEIYASGKAKAIGVSNYHVPHLQEMEDYAVVQPAVNQIECHLMYNRSDIVDYCRENDIGVTQYAPLARKEMTNDTEKYILVQTQLQQIAEKYNKSRAQIMLRWGIQRGNVVIPKSSNPEHIKENIDIFDFELSPTDMSMLNIMDCDKSVV